MPSQEANTLRIRRRNCAHMIRAALHRLTAIANLPPGTVNDDDMKRLRTALDVIDERRNAAPRVPTVRLVPAAPGIRRERIDAVEPRPSDRCECSCVRRDHAQLPDRTGACLNIGCGCREFK